MKWCNLMHAIVKQSKWTNFTLDLQTRWNQIIFLQCWRQKSLTLHETPWRKPLLILIFRSTFTHESFKHEHLFVLISSSSTFSWSQQNISTNSVSFINPICGGRSKTLYIGAETSYSRSRDTTLMSNWWTFVRDDVKLTQGQVYQVKATTAYYMKTRSAHKVSVQAALQPNNVERRHQVKW